MNFLTIYQSNDVLNQIVGRDHGFMGYFVQEDVHDFHVYRITSSGHSDDLSDLAVAEEKIDKREVMEKMGIDEQSIDVRYGAFRYVEPLEVIKAVISIDEFKGYEIWEEVEAADYVEALDIVTQENEYAVEVVLFEDTAPTREINPLHLHLTDSLHESRAFLSKLLADPRSFGYNDVTVSTYANGREQGYSLHYQDRDSLEEMAITFTVHKSSDCFKVYHGPKTDERLSSVAHRTAEVFPERHFNAAAHHVFGLLHQHAEKQEGKGGFTVHPALRMADRALRAILKNDHLREVHAYGEAVQTADRIGYVFCFPVRFQGPTPTNFAIIGNPECDRVDLYTDVDPFYGITLKTPFESFVETDGNGICRSIIEHIQSSQTRVG